MTPTHSQTIKNFIIEFRADTVTPESCLNVIDVLADNGYFKHCKEKFRHKAATGENITDMLKTAIDVCFEKEISQIMNG